MYVDNIDEILCLTPDYVFDTWPKYGAKFKSTRVMLPQVKTLKPLSTLKLQQLISLMEEESFADEEYIATEGEMGEKFFIIVLGRVSACMKAAVAQNLFQFHSSPFDASSISPFARTLRARSSLGKPCAANKNFLTRT